MSIRRIVTGHDESGKATVWLDGEAPNAKYPNEFIVSTLLWSTDETPADFAREEDYGNRILGTAPPENGTRFIMFEVAPGGVGKRHKTDSLDYVICISGEMTMTLEDSSVVLKPGDVLIQRGTLHGWENHGDVPAVVAIILMDGKPKRDDAMKGSVTAG